MPLLVGLALCAAAGAGAARVTAPRTAVQRQMAAVVTAWSARLDRRDNAGVARLFATPAVFVQGPNQYRLLTRRQIALWHSLLPCSGKVISVSFAGRFATAVFRLGNRGKQRCDAPGALAAARFEIVNGKIVSWVQVAVPATSAGAPVA